MGGQNGHGNALEGLLTMMLSDRLGNGDGLLSDQKVNPEAQRIRDEIRGALVERKS
jgi:hypothetical protein